MNKKIKKVRKSIESRKKTRGNQLPTDMNMPMQIHDIEEKHGYPPEISGYTIKRRESKPFLAGLVFKVILSGILFFSVAILMESNNNLLSKPKEVTTNLLKNDFPFAKVNTWYQEVFGSPLAFPSQTDFKSSEDYPAALPVNGQITESFQVNGKGVKITPGKETDVFSHQPGIVIFAGKKSDTDRTVIIQHADGTDSSYGFLSDIEVHHYQYVGAHQRIGSFTPEEGKEALYFSLERDNSYLDPVQVIEVDDAN
ncbi:peptidoglycan DD-metalloendopeptidase family protein [Oceanobacillus sp. CAU 1775]